MKILHTSDLHLSVKHPERFKALENIIKIATQNGVNIITISGDLFDSSEELIRIQNQLRIMFDSANLKIVVISGNHDSDVFKQRPFLGKNVKIINDAFSPVILENEKTIIWGIPYTNKDPFNLLLSLFEEAEKFKGWTNILLIHCDLIELIWDTEETGEEGNGRYMPVSTSYFQQSPFKFILAGHYHKNSHIISLENGGFFIYPGSPVSVTLREIGKRKVILLNNDEIDEIVINSYHINYIEIKLTPYLDPIKTIENKMSNISENALNIFKIDGFFSENNEEELVRDIEEKIKEIYPRNIKLEFRAKNIKTIYEDSIIKKVMTKLNQLPDSGKLKEFFLSAIIEKNES